MSDCSDPGLRPDELDERLDDVDADAARMRVGVALSLLELSAATLGALPPPEVSLERHDRSLFKYLRAARTLLDQVVGSEPGDTVDQPGAGSVLAAGRSIYGWSGAETYRRFLAALALTPDDPS